MTLRLSKIVFLLGLIGLAYWGMVGRHEFQFAKIGAAADAGSAGPSFADILSQMFSGGLVQDSGIRQGRYPAELSTSTLTNFVGAHVVDAGERQAIARTPSLPLDGMTVTQVVSLDEIRKTPAEPIGPAYAKAFVMWRASPVLMQNCDPLLTSIATKCRIDRLTVKATDQPDKFNVTAQLSVMPLADLRMPVGKELDDAYSAGFQTAPSWQRDVAPLALSRADLLARLDDVCAILTAQFDRCTLYQVKIEDTPADGPANEAQRAAFRLSYAIPLTENAPDPRRNDASREVYKQIEARINAEITAQLSR